MKWQYIMLTFFVKTKRQKSLQIMIGVSINYHKVNINGLKVQYY